VHPGGDPSRAPRRNRIRAPSAQEPTIAGTTEGGLSALKVPADAASSKLTPTVVYSDSEGVSDVETFKSDASSRLSSSRPASQLGPSRKARKQRRTEERIRARKEAAGLSYTDSTEYYRQRSIFPADGSHPSSEPGIAIKGSVVDSLTGQQITSYVVTRGAELEVRRFSMRRLCQSLPDTTWAEGELYDATNERVLAYDVCVLCGKVNASTHSSGKDHVRLVGIQAEISRLLGMPARGFREYSMGYISPTPTVSLSAFAQWWGRDEKSVVELFPLMVREKLNRLGVRVKYSENHPACLLKPDEVEAVIPAVVNYKAGAGKYATKSNKITFMHEVDGMPTDPDTEWWPVALVKPKPDFHVRERAVPDGDGDDPGKKCFDDEIEMTRESAEFLAQTHEDASSSQGPASVAKSFEGCQVPVVYASCIYQLAETAEPPVAWKIGVRVRERT
jgi:hypothetical protein